MKKITMIFLCLTTVWTHAGGLPEIYVTEVSIPDGGIYTVAINQPPAPPNPIWTMAAWGIANSSASFSETMLTGWTSFVFDVATWDSEIVFETGTPGEPIFLFTSGIAGLSDFNTLFNAQNGQAAVFWNESYIGNPLVATSSNFTWSFGTRNAAERAGETSAFAMISSSNGQNLICEIGVGGPQALVCQPIVAADADGDGVPDSSDNCTLAENPGQEDTDFDGYGNACDPDLNNDEIVNFLDISLFAGVFLTSDENADFNSDGTVNFLDLIVISDLFLGPPGPSAGF